MLTVASLNLLIIKWGDKNRRDNQTSEKVWKNKDKFVSLLLNSSPSLAWPRFTYRQRRVNAGKITVPAASDFRLSNAL